MKPLSHDFMDDLRRLRVLREFRERGTVTATAEALHLTPSAVSQQLAGLSHDLGFPVTRKDGRRIALTPLGEALLSHADAVFAHLEHARHDLQTFDETLRGTVRIGAFSTALAGLLPTTLDSLAADFPDLVVSVRQSEPPELFDQLDAGRLDVAIAVAFDGSPTVSDPRYHRVDLGADVLDVAVPADHKHAADASINLRDLATDQWITGSPGGCCASITATACAAAGFTPDIRHQVDDWLAVTQLVAHNHGVTLLPRLAQRNLPPGLAVRPVATQQPQRHLFAAVQEGGQNSPLLQEVLRHLSEAAATLAAC
ncbi:LysR family transcriptional regulator [Kribbella catacumbae]|uniref:LysR family transcriptional regulator n=1 Tax=Kribbella catacumbae TaxID=460086 RepID=UPI000477EBCC|nr:LysR family transcriptional regulator [Kribbella catacumbae]